MLPHIQNSEAGRNGYEMQNSGLFRVTFIPPSLVGDSAIATEHVTGITGITHPSPDAVQQAYLQSMRNYAGDVVDITQNITITFTNNLNQQNQAYIQKFIKSWKSIVWNPLTGERGLKNDYVGKMVIEYYNRAGDIFWERTLHNVFPTGTLDGFDSEVQNTEGLILSPTFVADYYTETEV